MDAGATGAEIAPSQGTAYVAGIPNTVPVGNRLPQNPLNVSPVVGAGVGAVDSSPAPYALPVTEDQVITAAEDACAEIIGVTLAPGGSSTASAGECVASPPRPRAQCNMTFGTELLQQRDEGQLAPDRHVQRVHPAADLD